MTEEANAKDNKALEQEFMDLTGVTVSQFKMLVEAVTTKVYEQLIHKGYVLPENIYDQIIASETDSVHIAVPD